MIQFSDLHTNSSNSSTEAGFDISALGLFNIGGYGGSTESNTHFDNGTQILVISDNTTNAYLIGFVQNMFWTPGSESPSPPVSFPTTPSATGRPLRTPSAAPKIRKRARQTQSNAPWCVTLQVLHDLVFNPEPGTRAHSTEHCTDNHGI
jgi:hypothetical protein